MQQLSERLMAIARCIPPGSRIVDVGTDHAYLPIYLVQAGICPTAVAGDVHQGPYQVAVKAVREAGLTDYIAVRKGDGLAVITPGEVEVAIIAGMGGGTIQVILEANPQVAESLTRLVLQPMVDAGPLRGWLLTHGWQLAEEDLVEEDGRIYELVVAVRAGASAGAGGLASAGMASAAEAGQAQADPVLLEVGPLLVKQGHPLLGRHTDKLIQDRARVLAQLRRSDSPAAREKAGRTEQWVARLEEIRETIRQGR
ncbi:MAG TPA: class I SAM-dependent methyltransferase [Bacillota bacterium]|nr:class I SAM-dependent methyltransferase [Bacillota bacterium]